MASLDEAAAKRPKLDESVRVQLKSVEGAELGPALEVPLASGPAELGSIVQKLKNGTLQPFHTCTTFCSKFPSLVALVVHNESHSSF